MKDKYLFKDRIKVIVILFIAMTVLLEGCFAFVLFGLKIDGNQATACKIIMCFLATVVPLSLFLLFNDYLVATDDGVTKYFLFIKKKQMRWSDVASMQIEERTKNNGTLKYIIIRDINDSEIEFMGGDKSLAVLRELYDNRKNSI